MVRAVRRPLGPRVAAVPSEAIHADVAEDGAAVMALQVLEKDRLQRDEDRRRQRGRFLCQLLNICCNALDSFDRRRRSLQDAKALHFTHNRAATFANNRRNLCCRLTRHPHFARLFKLRPSPNPVILAHLGDLQFRPANLTKPSGPLNDWNSVVGCAFSGPLSFWEVGKRWGKQCAPAFSGGEQR